jgi:hypothetical protein
LGIFAFGGLKKSFFGPRSNEPFAAVVFPQHFVRSFIEHNLGRPLTSRRCGISIRWVGCLLMADFVAEVGDGRGKLRLGAELPLAPLKRWL